MANLLESYSKRLAIAESVYSKSHNGEKMDMNRKMATAICLNNISKYLGEALDNSVGVQRGDLGLN